MATGVTFRRAGNVRNKRDDSQDLSQSEKSASKDLVSSKKKFENLLNNLQELDQIESLDCDCGRRLLVRIIKKNNKKRSQHSRRELSFARQSVSQGNCGCCCGAEKKEQSQRSRRDSYVASQETYCSSKGREGSVASRGRLNAGRGRSARNLGRSETVINIILIDLIKCFQYLRKNSSFEKRGRSTRNLNQSETVID